MGILEERVEFTITPKDVTNSVPSLAEEDPKNLQVWIDNAITEIEVAFARRDRDFYHELGTVKWLAPVARRVVRDMVSAVALVGPNAGVRSVSSTTGQESDSITYTDVDSVSWGGVKLTPQQLLDLGLVDGLPRGHFAPRISWPEEEGWLSVSQVGRGDVSRLRHSGRR